MIAVDFLLMEHKIHRDHEDAARARAPGERVAHRLPTLVSPKRTSMKPGVGGAVVAARCHRANRSIASAAQCRPMTIDAVAAGDGAFRTWITPSDSSIRKSSTSAPDRLRH